MVNRHRWIYEHIYGPLDGLNEWSGLGGGGGVVSSCRKESPPHGCCWCWALAPSIRGNKRVGREWREKTSKQRKWKWPVHHQVQRDVTRTENWELWWKVKSGGGVLSEKSDEWHRQTSMSPEGSWEVVSTLSTNLSVNTPLCFASLSSYQPLAFCSSISPSSCLLRLHYLASQVTETQCSSVLVLVGVRIIQLCHQNWNLTRETNTNINIKNCKGPKALKLWIFRGVTCFEKWIVIDGLQPNVCAFQMSNMGTKTSIQIQSLLIP